MLEEPIREFYTNDIPTVVSTKNEPKGTHYPNMFLAYQKFSSIFSLPTSRFILTNGCENALRVALLLLKPTSLSIENPTWGLVSIITKSLDIPTDTFDYHYINDIFVPSNPVSSVVYTTDTYNNLFKHDNLAYDNSKTYIIDETYTLSCLFQNKQVPDNAVVIGSFSKIYNPSIRLGYVLLPNNTLSNKLHLLREQYISQNAVDYLMSLSNKPQWSVDKTPNSVCSHSVYAVYNSKPKLPHKTFVVDNKVFYRVGV